jgi:sulfatase maturation enzyme AslB (radical SAM superfamily)
LDGVGEVHDRVRWPIKWDKFYANLMTYRGMGLHALNTWTTVSALNISDFQNILNFVKDHELDHSYAFLHYPDVINVKYTNTLTESYKNLFPNIVAVDRDNQDELNTFVQIQEGLRGI